MSENEMNEIKQALMELTVNIKHMDSKQDQMADDIKSIKEAIYNPETGLYARLRDVEQGPRAQGVRQRLLKLSQVVEDLRAGRQGSRAFGGRKGQRTKRRKGSQSVL